MDKGQMKKKMEKKRKEKKSENMRWVEYGRDVRVEFVKTNRKSDPIGR